MIKILRLVLVGFYLFAGSYHFINPDFYSDLIPDYLPFHSFINYASGIFEILLGLGIVFPKTRLLAAKGIIVLLILFIPSHVDFILKGSCVESAFCVAPWIAWVRLLIVHPILMYWVWIVRKTN
ncbi:MauE/DoxX family redox-associated membrane protein [Winogradskyella sp.]|uniref:DoxX family protein n=1 Tax=Winogradskyella sp. TaxID=1883156 RepID=UPI00261FA65A|nr:MauE/DoxX family redox-associated membrane protein [Winogradskyella sp.]